MNPSLILFALTAYLLAGLPTAYVLGQWRYGADIRSMGSRNVGAANAVQAFGWAAGFTVMAVDIAKGAIPMMLAVMIGVDVWGQAVVALAAVTGHNFSPYLRFSGGRGVATAMGASLVVVPWVAVAGFATAAIWFWQRRSVVAAGYAGFILTNVLVVVSQAPGAILFMCGTTSALVFGTHLLRQRASSRSTSLNPTRLEAEP